MSVLSPLRIQLFGYFDHSNLALQSIVLIKIPECFRYNMDASHASSFDEAEHENISRDAGQLMISSGTFISMGVGEDGAR